MAGVVEGSTDLHSTDENDQHGCTCSSHSNSIAAVVAVTMSMHSAWTKHCKNSSTSLSDSMTVAVDARCEVHLEGQTLQKQL